MYTHFSVLFLFLASMLNLSFAAHSARLDRALILGIDGLRADALDLVISLGKAPHIASLGAQGTKAYCPSLAAASCAKAHRAYDFDSSFSWETGPGWASVILGLDADRHGVKTNDHHDLKVFATTTKEYPSIFKILKDQGLKTAAAGLSSFLTNFNGALLTPGVVDYECGAKLIGPAVHPHAKSSCNLDYRKAFNSTTKHRDDRIVDQSLTWIESDAHLIMAVLDEVDGTGHAKGFDLGEAYLRAIEEADARAGKILSAIALRAAKHNENWLVILTSDHGGHDASEQDDAHAALGPGEHGDVSGKDNIVPFIVASYGQKQIEFDNLPEHTDVHHFDSFKTIARWFGLDRLSTVVARDGRSRIY